MVVMHLKPLEDLDFDLCLLLWRDDLKNWPQVTRISIFSDFAQVSSSVVLVPGLQINDGNPAGGQNTVS